MHRSSPINICPSSVNMSPNALEKDAGLKITELMCVNWDQLWVSTYFVYKDYISGHPSELIPGREDGVNIDIVVLMLNSHFFIGLLSFMYYTVTGVWIHHNFLMRDNKLNQSVNQWRFYSAVTSSPSNNICCCHGDPLQNCFRVWIKPTHCKVKVWWALFVSAVIWIGWYFYPNIVFVSKLWFIKRQHEYTTVICKNMIAKNNTPRIPSYNYFSWKVRAPRTHSQGCSESVRGWKKCNTFQLLPCA